MCKGNTGNYSLSPATGKHYAWSTTYHGSIMGSSTTSSLTVVWGIAGSASVKVYEYDASNNKTDSGTYSVTVLPLPAPTITASFRVACQQLTDTSKPVSETRTTDNPGVLDDKNGCIKVCEHSTVVYTANGASGSVYTWSVSGATSFSASGNTCTVVWGPVGPGSISVTETSSPDSCKGSKTICIDIIEKPHSHFFAQPDSTLKAITVCRYDSVIFVDRSTGTAGSPIVSWFWNFGDGGTFASSSSGPVQHGYNTPGTYTAYLVVKNACGCTDTSYMKITVDPAPGVQIYCPSVMCEGGVGTYSLKTPMACAPWLWSAIGGTVVGSSTSPSVDIQWDNVDTTGFGYVVFDPSRCKTAACKAKSVIKIPVIQAHGHISGPLVVCPNSSFLYSMPQWPTTIFSWNVISSAGATLTHNDQNNQIVLNTGGAETLTLQVKYHNSLLGCGGTAEINVDVLAPDSIGGPHIVCLNGTGTWTLTNGGSGDWTLSGPGGISATATGTNSFTPPAGTFSSTGTYTISATGTTFCPPTPIIVKVNPLPPAPDSLIGPDSVCFGSATLYKAKFPLAGTIFEWSVTGGGSVNAANGPQTYATFAGSNPNVLSVVRVTRDEAHCRSAALTKNVYKPVVTANITGTGDTVCPSTKYTYFSNYSKGETYTWSVTPGTASVQGNANKEDADILFNAASGPSTITLVVHKCDTDYTFTKNVYIRSLPTLTVSIPTQVCRDAPANVAVTSPVGTPSSYDWDWGDGTTHGAGNPDSHTYTNAQGTSFSRIISVKVNNPFGCPGFVTASQSINILPAPVASISGNGPFHTCTPPSDVLTGILQSGFEPTNQFTWVQVGVGSTGCTGTPPPCSTYTVSTWGTYYLVATGVNGCKDTSNYIVYDSTGCSGTPGGPGSPCGIVPNPTVSITDLSDCGIISLTGSYSPTSLAYDWDWNWPGGVSNISTTTTSLTGKVGIAGKYVFDYTVSFTNGPDTCIVTDTKEVKVALVAKMGHTVKCNSSGLGYDVTLHDNSNYFPGHAPTSWTFWTSNTGVTYTPHPTTTPSYFSTLAAGQTWYFKNVVHYTDWNGNPDSCTAYDTLVLPALPVASFVADRDTACRGQVAVNFTNTSTGLDLTYNWSWPSSSNTTVNPFIVFPNPGLFVPVGLQVTDRYGCTSTTSKNIRLITPNLDGSLSNSGNNQCSGSVVTLQYVPTFGTANPDTFAWMNDAALMYQTYYPVDAINVFDPGSYWTKVSNHYGCHFDVLPKLEINFVQTAPAEITGDTVACLNSPYTLYGYAGSDPSLTYQWYRGGTAISGATSDTYTDPAAVAGTYTYTLVVGTTYAGNTCYDTSAPFTVTVHSLPAPPTISFSMLNCSSYTLQLTASSGVSGATYNWSNGAYGNPVTQSGGGPIRVWLTDLNGCVSHADTMIPKDPRTYLWIFPTGCYSFCDKDTPKVVVGPIYHFTHWWYLKSGITTPILQGYGSYVTDLHINSSGKYTLNLYNGLCTGNSDTMDVSITHCEGCQQLMADISVMPVPCGPGCCTYSVNVNFNNFYGTSVSVNLSTPSTIGSFAPGAVLVPNGPSSSTLVFVPAAGFGGGPVTVTITYTDPSGTKHSCDYTVDINGCPAPTYRMAYPGSNNSTATAGSDVIFLHLVPNPANNSTRIDYKMHSGNTAGTIEVTDITGRVVERRAVDANIGNWQLQTAEYKSGLYIVTLREGGKVIQQTKLSIMH